MRQVTSETGNEVHIIESEEDLPFLVQWLEDHDVFGLDFETTSARPQEAELVGVGVGGLDKTAVYIPNGHRIQETKEIQKPSTRMGLTHNPKTGERYTRKAVVRVPWQDSEAPPLQVSTKETLKVIAEFLNRPDKRVVAHNWKFERSLMERWCRMRGIVLELNCEQDCSFIQDWLLRTERFYLHDLKTAAQREFGVKMTGIMEVVGGKRADLQMAFADITETARYCGDDAIYCVGLDYVHKPRLVEDGLLADYDRIEMPLISILIDMERRGVVIDSSKLLKLDDRLRIEMEEKHEEMAQIFGLTAKELPITSPAKMSRFLFGPGVKDGEPALNSKGEPDVRVENCRDWEPPKDTERSSKTGLWSTDKAAMNFFVDNPDHGKTEQATFSELKIRHSQIKKLLENYTLKIVAMVAEDGRIRAQTKQAGTVTGRFSMSDPSLHNIPSRSEDGKLIREAFVAEEGSILIVRDYSQIEPRLTGFLADDPVLLEIYTTGQDIYLFLANMLKEKTGLEVERSWAKALVLGLNYGMGYKKLAKDLGISVFLAKKIYADFFEVLRHVVLWKKGVVSEARQKGYITTIVGRRRYLPELNWTTPYRSQFETVEEYEEANDKARMMRAMGEREAVNSTVQGSAGDILKIAMRNMAEALKKEGLYSKAGLILTVHDELILESQNDVADRVDALLRDVMENAVSLGAFPLVAEGGLFKSWGAAK